MKEIGKSMNYNLQSEDLEDGKQTRIGHIPKREDYLVLGIAVTVSNFKKPPTISCRGHVKNQEALLFPNEIRYARELQSAGDRF